MFFKKLMLVKMIRNERENVAFYRRAFIIGFIFINFLSFSNIVFGQSAGYLTSTNPNSFTLAQAARTSAGVYRPDSTLVRTLWNSVNYSAGTYNLNWDGKDDLGNPMPAGNYIVKVVANNVLYTWMGIVGNTSDYKTGSTVHRGYYYCMAGMTIANGTAYSCSGYGEGGPSVSKFLTSTPQQKIGILPFNMQTANTDVAVTDGKIVYWAAYDPISPSNTFVCGTNVSDDSDVSFSSGVNFKPTYTKSYIAISLMNQANSLIAGLAVQKTGNFLFVSRAGLNQLAVLNKTTGQLIQTITINNPQALCVDMNDNLWMVSGVNTISKYTVNANGTLSAALLTITNTLQPIALAVSPDNSTLTVADAGLTSQQVKAFDNSTGTPTWTLGVAGGYMQDATVTNNKFYFNDVRGQMYAGGEPNFREFIAFQPDGSFWINDPGNFRAQHYAANRTFIETIMSMGATYSTWADKNDNTRVGAEYLEFKIDNTQPISGKTGWQLAKNWGATISTSYDKLTKITNFITLTSGGVSHTYGFLRQANYYYLVEFQSNNSLRFTGISRLHCNIAKDGSLLTDNFQRYAFLGFDSANNPIWSTTPVALTNFSTIVRNPPYIQQWISSPYVTSTGKVIVYDYGIQQSPTVPDNGFHLAAIKPGGNSYLWETGLATHKSYMGPFPDPSHFDVGNNVNNYAGSNATVLNQNIIAGYHGEFWKNSQTNMYNHYLDNGLAIGQFGTVGPYSVEAPAMMAGNALTPQLVSGANADEMYLWHGDESYHSGMHKWKISGLSTITQLDIPITYPSPPLTPITVQGNNLMVNLPYNSPLLNNTAGWTINPTTAQTGWSITTNALVSGVQNNPDIYVSCNSLTGNFSLNRDLGNNSGLLSWAVSGQISYYYTTQGGGMGENFDILDNNGKIISRITNTTKYVAGNMSTNTIYGNNQVLVSGLDKSVISPMMWQLQPVAISAINNLVTIKYAGYTVTAPIFDPTANISSPKTMRVYITGGFQPTGRKFDFKDMMFITTKANQNINFNSIPAHGYGSPAFALIANSSSNLPVTFTVVSGPAQIVGNTIVLTGTGNVVVQASQPGNTFYNSANPVTQSFNVTSQNISRIDH